MKRKCPATPTGESPDVPAAGPLGGCAAGIDKMPGYLVEHIVPADEMGILGEVDEVILGGDPAVTW